MCQPFALPDSKAFLLPLQRGANTNTLCIQRELLLVCVAQTLIAPIFFFFFFCPWGTAAECGNLSSQTDLTQATVMKALSPNNH